MPNDKELTRKLARTPRGRARQKANATRRTNRRARRAERRGGGSGIEVGQSAEWQAVSDPDQLVISPMPPYTDGSSPKIPRKRRVPPPGYRTGI